MNTVMTAVPHHHRIFRWSIVWPVLLIVFSLIALAASPFVTSLWLLVVIGCLLIFTGATQVVHAFQSTRSNPPPARKKIPTIQVTVVTPTTGFVGRYRPNTK
jgi:uncharacterized membrane protein HdeD (DUF308 family)